MAPGTGPSGQLRLALGGPSAPPPDERLPLPDEPATAGELGPDAALPGGPDDAALPGGPDDADEAPPASDAPVAVTTRLSPDPSSIGDLLTLEVAAAYPTGVRVNLPMGLDFSPLHLVSVEEGEPESTGQGLRKVFTITLQHFQVGEGRVPSFPMTWVGADGQVQTLKVPPTPFQVDALLANEADPKRQGEDPPVSLEYPAERAELVIYSAAVAMVLGFLLALLWRRLRRRPELVIGPPPVPPHERALEALTALEGAGLLETGLYQDYYVELTEIAKGYLEGRFGVDALDRTTDEIRRELVRSGDRIKPLSPDEVVRFLQECDLVKFARFAPEVDEARGALGRVRTMVEETKPLLKDMSKETGASGQVPAASPEGAPASAGPAPASAGPDPTSADPAPGASGPPAPDDAPRASASDAARPTATGASDRGLAGPERADPRDPRDPPDPRDPAPPDRADPSGTAPASSGSKEGPR
ncbi:MAG: hypothetical protein R3B09_00550 [Nannocystaceae bacterium]